jgi:hypothetical protein
MANFLHKSPHSYLDSSVETGRSKLKYNLLPSACTQKMEDGSPEASEASTNATLLPT